MAGLNSLTIRARWKAGQNVQFPAASYGRSKPRRVFILTKTTNHSIRASDKLSGKVEPLVAGEADLPIALMKLKALYPGCDVLMDF
jgi:hypothetical protein